MKRVLFVLVVVLALMISGSVAGAPTAENGKKSASGKTVIKSVDKAGKSHIVKGYVAMKAAPGTKKFEASPKLKSASLPRKVDLRSKMTKIEDQGETSSCVANAVAGSFEYWVKQATKQDYDVSRLFVYYNARWRNGEQDKDEGSVIQLAMEGLQHFGACSEKSWPFRKPLLFKKPNGNAYKEADKAKIKEMAQVPLELDAWKQALASGYPIVFGCLLFDSFDQCNMMGGVVPMPDPKDMSRSSHSGHSMCAVGYSDKEQVFIVRNSWGDQWGDKGYCYMPYNYLLNPQFNNGDSWVFIPETPIENTEDTWSNDDKPVTDDGRGVDFVINPYTIESYKDVEIVWWEETTIEYNEAEPKEYDEYVEYSASDNWDSMESFDCNEVIEDWEKENPGEESNLYVYDGDDAGEEVANVASEDVANDAGEEVTNDAGEEVADDAGEEVADDAGEEVADDAGEEVADDAGEEATDDAGEEATDDAGGGDGGGDEGGGE